MGTSQSSDGPGSGVPLVPPWTPPPPAGDGEAAHDALPQQPPAPASGVTAPAPLAQRGRFGTARGALGDYARTGDRSSLQRSVGHYVHKGYGGASTATRRFGGTAATAAALADYFARSGAARHEADAPIGGSPSARETIQTIVEAVRPVDGTLDAEANRAAIGDALAELLTQYPDADLMNLDLDQQSFVIERFTALDICRRFMLDLGKTITSKAPTASTAAARIKEVQDYIKESVASSFRLMSVAGRSLTRTGAARLVRDALHATFVIFEEYAT